MNTQSDAQLLISFARTGDEAPFQELLVRHGGMVFQTCLRVLGNETDAEDAAQAAFLTLSQKARDASVQRHPTIAGWLQTLAWRISMRLRAAAGIRRKHEREATQLTSFSATGEPTHEHDWNRLRPALDDALAELPEKYRLALVLCDLEGRSHGEAAELLTTPKRTVTDRVVRGRELLRKRLERRGVAFSLMALTGLLSANANASEVPAGFIAFTARAASLACQGKLLAGVTISGQVSALMQHGLRIFLWATLKSAALIFLALLALTGGGTITYITLAQNQSPPQAVQPVTSPTAIQPAVVTEKPTPPKKQREVPVQGVPIVHPFSTQIKLGKMLYVVSAEGEALIDFTAFGVEGANSAAYRWRFRPSSGAAETSGSGVVFEKYEIVTEGPTKGQTRDIGSKVTLEAGPLRINWSHSAKDAAWIYFPLNVTHYNILDNNSYNTFGVRSGENAPPEF